MITRFREARGLSKSELARRAKIGRVTLVRVEQGTQAPTLDTLERIAQALRVPIRHLLPEKRGAR